MSAQSNQVKGFTLVELLIVISIIAILSVIGITVFSGIQKGARDARRKADIDSIAKAYEVKYSAIGTYPGLTDNDFAGRKIPTPYEGGSYFVAGPNATPPTNKSYAVCGSLVDDNQCFSSSSSCFCKTSSQGEAIDTFSLGNPVQNGSFETDSNNDGLADNWTTYRAVNSVALVSSPAPVDGKFVQKVVINRCCYSGIEQTVTNLKPSTTYKETGWMYMESGHGPCTSVGVGMQGPGGETFTGCDRLDQWVQLTLTGKSDSSGNYGIDFQNWTDNAVFYVDAVRLEEVK